ncbi:AAA family ATPase [Geopsychrobacter electrodiphilus]|uniref:cytidylate kinase-like family protein n=1 Tax=Geopsychrobacter electrodiphilus TaxID=225196 RepID=UPI000372F704|nr:cytidylate kinase-like family protein [Geopsychrobacter electrodiphilus]
MSIIVISRATLTGSTVIAERVAKELQIPCISREIVVEAAQNAGVSSEMVEARMNQTPSFFDHYPERDVYLLQVQAELFRHAAEGSLVYKGHGGHLLLSEVPNLIRVHVVAPMRVRIAEAQKALGLDAKEAEKHIQRLDSQRQKWVQYLYRTDWDDPLSYDLVINLDKLNVGEASELVNQTARLACFAWTDERKQKVADLALATRVKADLARGGELFNGILEISAQANVLTIDGRVRTEQAREELLAAIKRTIGDAEIRFNVTRA